VGLIGTVANTGSNVTEQHTSDSSDVKQSDYPQQAIVGSDYASGEQTTTSDGTNDVTVTLGTTETTNNNTTNRGTVTNENTANTDYTKTIEGITGTSYPELIQKHRDALIRINDRIIEEMKNCFILVY
jgi:protein-disulfide isomerase-like protein with CxxC motif